MGKEAILEVMRDHSHCKTRTSSTNSVSIIKERGHYAAYVDHEFYCSGDTYQEVVEELSNDGIV